MFVNSNKINYIIIEYNEYRYKIDLDFKFVFANFVKRVILQLLLFYLFYYFCYTIICAQNYTKTYYLK